MIDRKRRKRRKYFFNENGIKESSQILTTKTTTIYFYVRLVVSLFIFGLFLFGVGKRQKKKRRRSLPIEHRQPTIFPREIPRISQLEERLEYKTGISLETGDEEDGTIEVPRTVFERGVSNPAYTPVAGKGGRGEDLVIEKSKVEKASGDVGSYNPKAPPRTTALASFGSSVVVTVSLDGSVFLAHPFRMAEVQSSLMVVVAVDAAYNLLLSLLGGNGDIE